MHQKRATEAVNPVNSGNEDARITYRSEVEKAAVITGAEQVKNWELYEGDTGDVYLNEKSMYEVTTIEKVLQPEKSRTSWDPEFFVYTWYTEQDNEKDETVLYANFQGKNSNEENVEISVRRNCFYPEKEGVGYITLTGFKVRQAATQWAPPTAYKDGTQTERDCRTFERRILRDRR